MNVESYKRLRCGCGSITALVTKRGPGRPKGAKNKPQAETKQRKQYAARIDGLLVCQNQSCSREFAAAKSGQRFCCDKCRNQIHNRAGQERRRNNDPRACGWCSVEFVPPYGSNRRNYCGAICQESAARKVRSGSTHRRRAAKFGCSYEFVNKRKVFERDGWRCYLCGVETPRELSGTTNDKAPELDHVVPMAKGGPHSYENTRCACRSCNRRKGVSTVEVASV